MRSIFASIIFLTLGQFAFAQDNFLMLRSGGGFTGSSNVYRIDKDGRVFRSKGINQIAYAEQAALKKSRTKKYFRKAKKLFKTNSDFNHPGNVYYSISLTNKNAERKITWGDSEHPVPEDIKKLYEQLISIVSTLTFLPLEIKK
jgi:hypothetical protein